MNEIIAPSGDTSVVAEPAALTSVVAEHVTAPAFAADAAASIPDATETAVAIDGGTEAAASVQGAAAAAAPAALPEGFIRLGLAPELVQAVADLGYQQPTGVQLRAIPLALPADDGEHNGYNDLMVSSQTGSGKTAAFLLPVLHTLLREQNEAIDRERADYERACAEATARGEAPPKRPRRKNPTDPRNFKAAQPGALVLCPTRELAQQVAHDAVELVRHCKGLRIAHVVGGMPYQLQIARLQNASLVVATPGRLLDLQRSMQIKLDQVQFLVIDEADRMLDLGFSDDLAEVNNLTKQRRQTMMFSATFAPRIQQLAMRVMHDNGSHVHKVQVDSPQEKHSNIRQVLFWADNAHHKRTLLDHWLRDSSIDQAIVFASTQIECDGLATDLQQAGFSAVALHGALSQGLRNRRLMALRNGQVQILVATDVAARGIDVPTITHVFNFGLPMKAEDYTHRIGRTGRAGRDGLAVTFAEFRDRRRIYDIETYTRQPFKAEVIPGMEPRERPVPQERFSRGGKGPGKGGGGRREGFGQARGFGDRSERRYGSEGPDRRFNEGSDRRFGDGGDRGDRRFGDGGDRRPAGGHHAGYGAGHNAGHSSGHNAGHNAGHGAAYAPGGRGQARPAGRPGHEGGHRGHDAGHRGPRAPGRPTRPTR